jgi:hypothetical protein
VGKVLNYKYCCVRGTPFAPHRGQYPPNRKDESIRTEHEGTICQTADGEAINRVRRRAAITERIVSSPLFGPTPRRRGASSKRACAPRTGLP